MEAILGHNDLEWQTIEIPVARIFTYRFIPATGQSNTDRALEMQSHFGALQSAGSAPEGHFGTNRFVTSQDAN
jgi:hypothetical protein